jgi:hypothetical protein
MNPRWNQMQGNGNPLPTVGCGVMLFVFFIALVFLNIGCIKSNDNSQFFVAKSDVILARTFSTNPEFVTEKCVLPKGSSVEAIAFDQAPMGAGNNLRTIKVVGNDRFGNHCEGWASAGLFKKP